MQKETSLEHSFIPAKSFGSQLNNFPVEEYESLRTLGIGMDRNMMGTKDTGSKK